MFLWCGAAPIVDIVLYVMCVCVGRRNKITGGCGILLSNIIVKKVIEVEKLDEGNTSAAGGK